MKTRKGKSGKLAGANKIGLDASSPERWQKAFNATSTIASALAEAKAFEDIVAIALELLTGVLDLSAAGVLLFEERTDELRLVAYRGDLPLDFVIGSRVRLDESSAGTVIRDRRPIVLQWEESSQPDGLVSRMVSADSNAGAAVAIPLESAGQPLGVLCVTFSAGRTFQPEDLRVLQTIADQLAVAIQRDKLYDALAKDRAELQAVRNSMVKVEEMRSTFLSAVSHELLTPLAIIKGHAETLRDPVTRENAALLNGALTAIDEEAERLRRLVANIIDVARIQGGGLRLELAPLALPPLVQKIVQRFRGRSRRHRIETSFPVHFPLVLADRERVESILYNLLDNAIKYSPRGGTIRVAGEVAEKEVLVRVTDEGVGIAWNEQERIFEPFYRVTGMLVPKAQGSGLGLYITKTIVEGHGGRIWVESRPGRGATFVFALPREAPAELPSVLTFARRYYDGGDSNLEEGVRARSDESKSEHSGR